MKTIIVFALLALSSVAFAQQAPAKITATDTGISGDDLADTPLSNAIHMEGVGRVTNQLSWTIVVTPGSSTRIRVTCYESEEKTTNFSQISFCDTDYPSACQPDVREFTLSDYATVGGKKYIPSRWGIKKSWAKCSVDDPDDGTGTVVLTGERSWQ